MKQQPGKNIVLSGGFRIAQTFVKLGLVDEYQLIVHPIVLGTGNRLFDVEGWHSPLKLRLASAKPFDSGVVALHYEKT